MAQSKELQLREGYQDPAQKIGFNPLQVADASGAMKENRQVALQNMQREDQMLTKAETAALEWAKNNDTEKAAELATFSESLQKVAKLGVQEYWKNQAKVGIARARESGVSAQDYLDYHERLNRMKTVQAGGDAIANQSLAAGEPFEVANVYKGLSGIAKIYARQELARQAGASYEGWMDQQLKTNNTLKLKTKDGLEEFTPAMTGDDPVRRAQAIRALDDIYYEQFGLLGINHVLLQDHAFEKMNAARSKLIGESRENYAISQSFNVAEQAKATLLSDGNILNFVRSMSSTVDEKGNHRNLGGAWKAAWDYLEDLDAAGQLTEELYQRIQNTPDNESGKTVGERWKTQFAKFDKERADRNRKDAANIEADKKAAFKVAEDESLAYLMENGGSSADVAEIQKKLFQDYGIQSEKLNTFASTYSTDAEAKKRLDGQFESLASMGLLTTEMVMQAPLDMQSKWAKIAESQEAAFGGATFKTELKALEGMIKNDPAVKLSVDGSMGMGTLVVADMQANFRKKVASYAGLMPMEQAVRQALAEVKTEFETGKVTPGSKYYIDPTKGGEFTNFLPKNAGTSSKALNAKLNKIRASLVGGGRASLDKPGLIYNRAELESIERGYGKPGWTIPATAQYWASELNINPLEIINRQRKAAGLKELATPASIASLKGTISPGLQGLLNRFPSPNRSVRALSSAGAYNPAIVPNGYGETILKSATKHNIDPGILAGLLETESGFRNNQTSKAGAKGIAQIVPEYHPGVNTSDPIASIDYAAKYLSQLQRQFGGDMRLALLAYNGGPGNIAKYRGPIPGSAENQAYYSKVIKAASKYGYGQAWRDPALLRKRFQPIEHLSGDKSHGSYRADHGGANYHEHLAFSTPEEARAAAAKLRAAGIKITELKGETSVGTHSKNSYHYSGMAFDVPADQVPPGKEQELSRRVRSILGIS